MANIYTSPHHSVQDDVYEGYFIPKGSTIIANLWELNRDRELFGPDVDDFNPNRYLDEDGNLLLGIAEGKDDAHFSFGQLCFSDELAPC